MSWCPFKWPKNFGIIDNTDVTTEFQAELARKLDVVVPPGTYRVDGLRPKPGSRITLQAGARLVGVNSSSKIFQSEGSTPNICLGGWGEVSDAAMLWEHIGDGALAASYFNGLRVFNIGTVFDLSSAVGCEWGRQLRIGGDGGVDNVGRGIYFRSNGSGQTNLNHINSKFLHFDEAALEFADSSIAKNANFVSGWFEDGSGPAIVVGGSTKLLTIEGSYFETNNSADPDIKIEVLTGTCSQVVVKGSEFAASGALQTERIGVSGNAGVVAERNSVTLSPDQMFAKLGGPAGFENSLHGNYLNAVGGGSYESRLYAVTGSAVVEWSSVPSGFVTNDDRPMRVSAGSDGGGVVTFPSGDATPSVRNANIFKTAGTASITDFDDGAEGQRIMVRAGNNIDVLGVSMVLGDVAEFVLIDGAWEHLNK